MSRLYRVAFPRADGSKRVFTKAKNKGQVLSELRHLLNTCPISNKHAIEVSIQRLNPKPKHTLDLIPSTSSHRNPEP